MKNIKPAIWIIAILVIVLGIGGMFLLRNKSPEPVKNAPMLSKEASKEASSTEASSTEASSTINEVPSENISIKIDKLSLAPFDILEIDGRNLDPDAATSIIFTSQEQEIITIPALSVTSTSVVAAVPPFKYNKDSGKFQADIVSLKVIQVKKDGEKLDVKTSNEIAGIQVSAPATPSVMNRADAVNLPAGTITRAFVVAAIESLKNAQTNTPASSTELVASLAKSEKGMEDLLSALDGHIKNPQASVKLTTTDGGTAVLDAAKIAWLDALFSGYLGSAEEHGLFAVKKSVSSLIPAAEAAGTDCQSIPDLGGTADTILGLEVNCLRDESLSEQAELLGGALYDKLRYDQNFWVAAGSVVLGIATGGLSIEAQIGCAVVYSVATDLLVNDKMPDASSLPGIWNTVLGGYGAVGEIKNLIDHIAGVPITENLSQAADIFNKVCKYGLAPTEFCEQGKAILAIPGNLLAYMENGIVDRLSIPDQNKGIELNPMGYLYGSGYETMPLTPTPVKKTPVKTPITIVQPTPKPPTPKPPVPTCAQTKQSAYAKCNAGCATENDNGKTYGACISACGNLDDLLKKADCSNICIGNWEKGLSDQSKCSAACMDAENVTVCP